MAMIMINRNFIKTTIVLSLIVLLIVLPAAAMSKDDLMAFYRSQPISKGISSLPIQENSQKNPENGSFSFLTPKQSSSNVDVLISQIQAPSISLNKNIYSRYSITCPPFVPHGQIHFIQGLCHDSQTGNSYYMAVDDMGTIFVIKEGCSACSDAPHKYSSDFA
jgi:hypothetical protein